MIMFKQIEQSSDARMLVCLFIKCEYKKGALTAEFFFCAWTEWTCHVNFVFAKNKVLARGIPNY